MRKTACRPREGGDRGAPYSNNTGDYGNLVMTSRLQARAPDDMRAESAHVTGDLLGEKPVLTNLQFSAGMLALPVTFCVCAFYLFVFYRKNAKVSEKKRLITFRANDGTAAQHIRRLRTSAS